jgi:hypothetical protein
LARFNAVVHHHRGLKLEEMHFMVHDLKQFEAAASPKFSSAARKPKFQQGTTKTWEMKKVQLPASKGAEMAQTTTNQDFQSCEHKRMPDLKETI